MDAPTTAEALRRATAARGHQPAVTVLGAGPGRDRRDEQAFASVQQWVAKGAHLLEVDLGLGPGDLLLVDAPAGWLVAAVCHAAWWVGAGVTDDPDRAVAAVVHEDRLDGPSTRIPDRWAVGDAIDGTPTAAEAAPDVEPWALAVQAFPDQPPIPRAAPDQPSIVLADGTTQSQQDVLAAARALPAGRLGVRGPLDLGALAVTLAARPAATGQPVVLVVAATDDQCDAERVAAWA